MTTNTSHNLVDALDDLLEIRPFPASAHRLIQACKEDNVTANELSDILATDPALAVKLLQLANSPIYGHSGQISSIQHATVIIGMRGIKNLALSTAVGEVFGQGDLQTASVRQSLWLHSLTCGSIARTLSRFTKISLPEEVFLAGVVHDVGKLFFTDHRPFEYSQLLSSSQNQNIVTAEEAAFGIAHTAVGGRCSRLWGLPDEISDAICFHHAPEESDFASDIVDLVHAANQLARLWPENPPEEPCAATVVVLQNSHLDLSPEEITDLRIQALTDLETTLKINQT